MCAVCVGFPYVLPGGGATKAAMGSPEELEAFVQRADQGRILRPVVSRHVGHESMQTTVDVYGYLGRSMARAGPGGNP